MILEEFEQKVKLDYVLTRIDLGKYQTVKGKGMTFALTCYDVKDIGRLTLLSGKGMMGMMKMESIILTPLLKDAPILSYDCMHAMGKDILIIELINTLVYTPLDGTNFAVLDPVIKKYDSLPKAEGKKHWYDNLLYPQSVYFKGRRLMDKLDSFSKEYLQAFIKGLDDCDDIDRKSKESKCAFYVNNLLANGGPAVDMFKKIIGDEETRTVFGDYIFGCLHSQKL